MIDPTDVPDDDRIAIPSPGRDRLRGARASKYSKKCSRARKIAQGTAHASGIAFFQTLVKHLARAVDAKYAFIAEFAGSNTRVRTIAYWGEGQILDNEEWDLPGTPCEDVVQGNLCHHPTGVRLKFPGDAALVEMGIESYLGVPLLAPDGEHLGHLAVFDTRPMPREPRKLLIFRSLRPARRPSWRVFASSAD